MPWGSGRGGRPWRRLRAQVLREEPRCRVCRIAPSQVCDHIVPLSQGGTDARSNLQGLCQRCSNAKTARESHGQGLTRRAEDHPMWAMAPPLCGPAP